MTDFEPVPSKRAVEEIRHRWRERTDTFDRVYDAVLGITDPTPYAEIAEVAGCSPNAAKKHLDRLAEIGVVTAHRDGQPIRYERDDGYLEWQEARRLARDLSVDEMVERVAALEERKVEFETRYDATDPTTVSVLDAGDRGDDDSAGDDSATDDRDDHDAVHERMAAVSEWRAIDREIRLYELARRMALNDGRLLPA